MNFERKFEGSGFDMEEVRWGKRVAEEMVVFRDEEFGRCKIGCHCIHSQSPCSSSLCVSAPLNWSHRRLIPYKKRKCTFPSAFPFFF